ncbi:hypothetical protein AVEN_34202-1 [Araneus ventricosus]|uniref:Uncharacterized protein n=1 Tax=Araneus ventricosus TaxID=182803 RepID=A0A4Y2GJ96_ARAVE|nr:hypothetical protein AVEN_34202-1 [Araneus ventricosus]
MVNLDQWLASPLRNREIASSIPGCVSYSVFAIICNKFARQACGKLAASSFHGDFGAFVNLLQACTLVMTNLWQTCTLVMTNLWQTCTLVMTNLWQACCKLKLLPGLSLG